MQSLSIFIVESQTVKRRLLKIFDLLDACRSLNWNPTEWLMLAETSRSPELDVRSGIRVELALLR
jgi:hypothetical protein